MKGCFLLQRAFAPVGHAMAFVFTKKYNVLQHCAFTSIRANYEFLKNQTDVTYTKILSDEELHTQYKNETLDLKYLQWLEKEYGIPNLWPYLTIDRVLMQGQLLRFYPYDKSPYTHEELLRILQVTAKRIIEFFDTEKPNFIFLAAIGSLGPLLLYKIAEKKSIPVFVGEYSRFKNHYTITESPREFLALNQRFLKIKNKEIVPTQQTTDYAKNLINSFEEKPTTYDETTSLNWQSFNRGKQLKFLLPTNICRSINCFLKTLIKYYSNKEKDYMQINPWFYLVDRLYKKMRVLRGYEDLYDTLDEKDEFVHFPLSFEPELSLLFESPFATDQIYVIKQLAKSLPIHYKLYVKEHPLMFGFRTRKFYKEIKKMPNVKLVHPGIKNFDLIKRAKIVATINGTAGWEALLLKKPVVTFGSTFYNSLPMVKYCTSMHDLATMVKDQLENFHFNEQDLLNFVIALLEDTVPVDMLHLWEYRDQHPDLQKIARGVEPLVDLLAKRLNLS